MAIRLETLGGLRVLQDGAERVRLPRQRLRCALLVLLALERRVPRERVLQLFWPDRAPERGRRALSQMLYELRQSLEGEWVELSAEHVVAAPELSIDAAELRSAVARGDSAQVERLYRGPFLDSVRLAETHEFERWVEQQRSQAAGLFRGSQQRRVDGLVNAGDLSGALAAARRWVLAGPLEDDAQHTLIELLAQSGLRNEAIRQFEDYQARLSQFAAEPLARTCQLVDEVRQGKVEFEPRSWGGPSAAPPLGARTGVVVLPFEDMSREKMHGHFCDGLAEEIITALSTVAGLRVVPRTSAFAFRGSRVAEAARALGVTHAVEGSTRFAADRYRVTVRVIDAETETEIWQDKLQAAVASTDLFEVQDQIAATVAEALGARLGLGDGAKQIPTSLQPSYPKSTRNTSHPEAYDLYLKGRQAWFLRTPQGFRDALTAFERAVALDPTYARAYAGIADVYNVLGGFDYAAMAPGEAYPRAEEAASKSLELDPELSAAHAAQANVLMSYHWDWDAAEGRFREAIRLNPGYSTARQWYSNLLRNRGRMDEALGEASLALELDPKSAPLSSNLARHFQIMRKPQRASEQFRQALTLDPGLITAHFGLSLAYLQMNQAEECVSYLEEVFGGASEPIPLVQAITGYAYGVMGQDSQARSVCQRLKASRAPYVSPEFVAFVYLGLEEIERAITWLLQAGEARSQVMTLLAVEPFLDPLRGNERFEALLAEAGLADVSV